jgi:hypothetical protein
VTSRLDVIVCPHMGNAHAIDVPRTVASESQIDTSG